MRLAVIGHVEWVTFARAPFVPAAGEIVHLEEPFSQPAGGGAVTAVALARMGAEVTFYTALGNDGRSQPELEAHGVRVEAAFRDRPQTEVLALLDPAGERTLFVVGENDAPVAGDPLPWDEIAEMEGCYFTGYDPATVRLGRRAPCSSSPPAASTCWSRAASAPTRWSEAAAIAASGSTSSGSPSRPPT